MKVNQKQNIEEEEDEDDIPLLQQIIRDSKMNRILSSSLAASPSSSYFSASSSKSNASKSKPVMKFTPSPNMFVSSAPATQTPTVTQESKGKFQSAAFYQKKKQMEECSINEGCGEWKPLVNSKRIIGDVKDADIQSLVLRDCGAGPKSRDCGFLSIAKALYSIWPLSLASKSLETKQLHLRQLLWEQISKTKATLKEFTDHYKSAGYKKDPQYADNQIVKHDWSNENERELQVYIVGLVEIRNPDKWSSKQKYSMGDQVMYRGIRYIARDTTERGVAPFLQSQHEKDEDDSDSTDSDLEKEENESWQSLEYNRMFEGDSYAFSWLVRSAIFQENHIRLYLINSKSAQIVLAPLDYFDPILEEQDSREYDIMKYVLLWHSDHHWQLIGQKDSSVAKGSSLENKDVYVLLSFAQLPQYIRSSSLQKRNNFQWNEDRKEEDNLDWSKLDSKAHIELMEDLVYSFKISDLWERGIERLLIVDNSFTQYDTETDMERFGQLFFHTFSTRGFRQILRCELGKLLKDSDSYTIDKLMEIVNQEKNWNMHDDYYARFKQQCVEFATQTSNRTKLSEFLQWMINRDSTAFRLAWIREKIPFDYKAFTKYDSSQKYKKGDLVYIPTFPNRQYYECIVSHSQAHKPSDDAKNKYWSLIGYRSHLKQTFVTTSVLSGSSKVTNETEQFVYYSFDQALTLWKFRKPPKTLSEDLKTFSIPSCSSLSKISFPLARKDQYIWNWSQAQFTIWHDNIRYSLGVDEKDNSSLPNDKRNVFMQKVMGNAESGEDDSFFRVDGPWASIERYVVILNEMKRRVSELIVDESIAMTLLLHRSAWNLNSEYWNYEEFVNEVRPEEEKKDSVAFIRALQEAIQTDNDFIVSSDISLSLLINNLNFPDDSPETVRHIIILRQTKPESKQFTFIHIQPEHLPSVKENITKHLFAIVIEKYEVSIFVSGTESPRGQSFLDQDEENNNVPQEYVKKWFLLASPNENSLPNRWIRFQDLPVWFVHSLFSTQQLLSIHSVV
jgi:hypothetical protein